MRRALGLDVDLPEDAPTAHHLWRSSAGEGIVGGPQD